MACDVLDRAIQVHGGAGICDDVPLARLYGWHRAMRLFDGPDEVHWRKAGQLELQYQSDSRLRGLGLYTPPRDASEPFFRYTTDAISAESSAAVSIARK